jgi:hypothetical protein
MAYGASRPWEASVQSPSVPRDVLRSVHRDLAARRLTCPLVLASIMQPLSTSHLATSARFRAQAAAWYPASYAWRPLAGAVMRPGFLLPFGVPAFASWPSCSRQGLNLPCGRPSSRLGGWTLTGFPRCPRARRDRGGRLLCPGTAVLPRPVRSPRPSPALSSASPAPWHDHPSTGLKITRHTEVHRLRPSGLPLTCGPRMERAPLGLSPMLRTPPLPAAHVRVGDGSASTDPELRVDSTPTHQRALTRNVHPRVAPPFSWYRPRRPASRRGGCWRACWFK